ncbi:MAG: putative periplasmic-binding protein [Hyphomicrobiales bacterium]|nr:putative periplasmic-binding protein [Hyphomicrobiales bacterium]
MTAIRVEPSVLQDLAPSGALRAAIAIGDAGGAFWSGLREDGAPRGVAVDLAAALADDLGVPVSYVRFENSNGITQSADADAWDVTFVPMDAERARRMAFGPVYNGSQSTLLARAGAPFATLAEADAPHARILAIAATTTGRALAAWLKNVAPIEVATIDIVMERLRAGEADAFAMGRESLELMARSLPGARVLPGQFFEAKTAVATPHGRAAGLAFASAFVERAKADGRLRAILDANGMADAPIP